MTIRDPQVEPLDAILIALVDAIDAQEAGTARGEGLAALADPDRAGTDLVDVAAPARKARISSRVRSRWKCSFTIIILR